MLQAFLPWLRNWPTHYILAQRREFEREEKTTIAESWIWSSSPCKEGKRTRTWGEGAWGEERGRGAGHGPRRVVEKDETRTRGMYQFEPLLILSALMLFTGSYGQNQRSCTAESRFDRPKKCCCPGEDEEHSIACFRRSCSEGKETQRKWRCIFRLSPPVLLLTTALLLL